MAYASGSSSNNNNNKPPPSVRSDAEASLSPNAASERTPLLRVSSASSVLSEYMNKSMDVYSLIMRIRRDLVTMIDTPLSSEQLASPRISLSVIKPLSEDYFRLQHPAILFALFVCHVHFARISSHALSLHSVNATRAALCETLATNVLRRWADDPIDEDGSDDEKLLELAGLLARNFNVFSGAPKSVTAKDIPAAIGSDWSKGATSALELAIVCEAKLFLRSQPCQDVIAAIWTGKIVYSAKPHYSILPDHYKRKPVTLYNPGAAPFLDHYRLQVPRIRATLELCHFVILFASYFAVLETRVPENPPNKYEWWFIIYGLGFTLDQVTSGLELGWTVFSQNLWNGLDALFCITFAIYLGMLANGELVQHHSVLSAGAVFLLPRLAFVILSDNLMVLALRAMLAPFTGMVLLATWCFAGFLYALWLLGGKEFNLGEISKLMLWLLFGLDGTGIQKAPEFHPSLGPILIIIYTCLANTLLTTVLVAILTNVFADIDKDVTAESLFRRTVVAFQGIKSDGLFNYSPPLNLLALTFLGPLRLVLSPRKFHSLNVFCTRVFSGPILIAIAVFEGRHARFLPASWRNYLSRESSVFHLVTHCRDRFFTNRPAVDAVFDSAHARSTLDEDSDPLESSHRRSYTNLSASGKTLKGKKSSRNLGLGSKPGSPLRDLNQQQQPATGSTTSASIHAPLQQRPNVLPGIRKRRESALASIFAPPTKTPESPISPQHVDEMRERLGNLEDAVSRIEAGLNALLESGGHATEG